MRWSIAMSKRRRVYKIHTKYETNKIVHRRLRASRDVAGRLGAARASPFRYSGCCSFFVFLPFTFTRIPWASRRPRLGLAWSIALFLHPKTHLLLILIKHKNENYAFQLIIDDHPLILMSSIKTNSLKVKIKLARDSEIFSILNIKSKNSEKKFI